VRKSFIAIIGLISILKFTAIQAQGVSWYKSYFGTIGTYPVILHLHKMGNTVNGYYYYQSRMQPLYIIGDDTSAGKNGIQLFSGINTSHEVFTLNLSGKKVSGTWKKDPENKAGLPVTLSEKTGNPQFDMIYTTGSLELRPGMEESPAATYSAAAVWPKDNSLTANLIKRVVNEEFGSKNSTNDIGKVFLEEKKQFFADYMEENKDFKDSLLKEFTYSYNMDQTQWINIAFHSAKILTLADMFYSYTGGAHGNYYTNYISLDLVNNKKLKLSDVLNAAGIKKLNPLLGKYFRKDRGLSLMDDLSEGGLYENKIEPNENFFVTTKGIGFSYAPYEIAPYTAGEIVVFIPFTELNAYLQPKFKELIR